MKPNNQQKRKAPVREIKEFDEEVIQIDRVTRVVKGGRRLRFRATVVIGNRKGKVGVGIGKSTEVTGAISKAIAQAKKSLVTVPMAGQTIPHRVYTKFKSAKILLMPACPGTGIIAGGPLRKIVELAGLKDILSKSIGCKNRLSNSQAAIEALRSLRTIPWLKKETPKVEATTPIPTEHPAGHPTKEPTTNHSGKPQHSKPANHKTHAPKTAVSEVKAPTHPDKPAHPPKTKAAITPITPEAELENEKPVAAPAEIEATPAAPAETPAPESTASESTEANT